MRALGAAAVGALLVAAGVLWGRSLALKTPDEPPAPAAAMGFDEAALAARLARAVRIPTISNMDRATNDAGRFVELQALLRELYPRAFAAMTQEPQPDGSLLLTWTGKDPALKPALLLSHMDVVPISPGTEHLWEHAPFSGDVADGYVWGRGTLDDKSGVLGLLEAAEALLAQGFAPKRTVIFAFGYDEEIGGLGAQSMARLLEARGVEADYVLDEGGIVAMGMMPGLKADAAMIGITEKGYLNVELAVEAQGGHSSTPPRESAIGRLARAISRLEDHPMPGRIDGALKAMLATLAPRMGLGQRVAISNLWLFAPLLRLMLEGTDTGRASLHTTMAATIFQSGDKDNVLPARARAVVNMRLLPGDSIAACVEHVKKAIADPKVLVTPMPGGKEASPLSDPAAAQFGAVARTVRQVFPDVIPAPYLTIGGTDASHYARISKNVYRFLPARFTAADMARFHGTNERISVANYGEVVRFFAQLMRNTAG